ncbi:hypothetical protein ACWX0K_12565 [Nitrobacteraceae bacterium UC4446_H13]
MLNDIIGACRRFNALSGFARFIDGECRELAHCRDAMMPACGVAASARSVMLSVFEQARRIQGMVGNRMHLRQGRLPI